MEILKLFIIMLEAQDETVANIKCGACNFKTIGVNYAMTRSITDAKS